LKNLKSLAEKLKFAITRQEKKQKEVANAINVDRCHFCRILNGKAPLQPDIAARLMKMLKLEDLAVAYCSGCPIGALMDGSQYRPAA